MSNHNSIDEILDFAIGRENDAIRLSGKGYLLCGLDLWHPVDDLCFWNSHCRICQYVSGPQSSQNESHSGSEAHLTGG